MEMIKVKEAQKMGEYKRTSIDEQKKEMDFLLISIIGNYYTIDWKNGNRETMKRREFNKLAKKYNYMTNF